jgi:hypothetical protein
MDTDELIARCYLINSLTKFHAIISINYNIYCKGGANKRDEHSSHCPAEGASAITPIALWVLRHA